MKEEKIIKHGVDAFIEGLEVHSTIPIEGHSAEKSLERLMGRIDSEECCKKHVKIHIRYYQIALAAACIAILLAVGALLFLRASEKDPSFVVMNNTTGRVQDVILSDGTVIKLNDRSKLTYPETFSRRQREVFLDGEAYFEVAHNDKCPFIVRASELKIKVLGTKFAINAAPMSAQVSTILVDGSVDVISDKGHFVMSPGQKVTYNEGSGAMFLENLRDVQHAIRWTKNVWVLSNTPFLDICQRLEYIFNIKFIIMNEDIINKTYTGEFDTDESLESIMNTMKTSTKFTYEIKDKTIIIR